MACHLSCLHCEAFLLDLQATAQQQWLLPPEAAASSERLLAPLFALQHRLSAASECKLRPTEPPEALQAPLFRHCSKETSAEPTDDHWRVTHGEPTELHWWKTAGAPTELHWVVEISLRRPLSFGLRCLANYCFHLLHSVALLTAAKPTGGLKLLFH